MVMGASKFRTKDLTYTAICTALLAVCSWIAIPTPSRIDFTMQTLGIFLAGGILGGKRGTLAILAYLLLGFAGAPVFAGFSGGVGALLTPSGGFLIGFLFTGLVMWAMERAFGTGSAVLALSMALGMLVYNAFGTAWFMVAYPMGGEYVGLWTALSLCVFPYLFFDFLKLGLALGISFTVRRHVR